MSHYDRLKRIYEAAPCNVELGPVIQIDRGRSEVRLMAKAAMHHAAGAVHGSFYFKLLDDAAFFAANSLVDDVFVLTVQFSLQLVRPVRDGLLRATGRVTRSGRDLIFAESELYDDSGQELARGHGTFARSSVRLEHGIGAS
jgi:uncharacterized protein (TIGR00369 family)